MPTQSRKCKRREVSVLQVTCGRRVKQKKLETQLESKNVFCPLLIIKVRVHRKPRGMTEIIQEAVKEREEERREGAGGG